MAMVQGVFHSYGFGVWFGLVFRG